MSTNTADWFETIDLKTWDKRRADLYRNQKLGIHLTVKGKGKVARAFNKKKK